MLIEMPYLFPGKIYRSPMPFSRFDQSEIWKAFRENAVEMVVVLTEQAEYLVYSGRDLPAFYRSQGLDALHIPVPDFGIPQDMQAWENGLIQVARTARDGKNAAIHCLAGLGRTGTFLACLAKKELGLDGEEAIRWVRDTLPGALENSHQEKFVIDY
ncbi:MAG TPA: protein-tyrosine-phosphatase [Chloroflexi bacterium]|nr:protein-tyrosine-phosphatase [Chloroflexota bacterium]